MGRNRLRLPCGHAALAAALLGWPARRAAAGGLGLYEVGSPDLGTASAGRAALAEDASTAWGNPAGMTRLQGSQLTVGLQPLIATTEFDVGTRTQAAEANVSNAGVAAGSGYAMNAIYTTLPAGCADQSVAGAGYYACNGTWFGPSYGANGVFYRVVPAP